MVVAKVYIHGGDYDCSELVRMCYRAVGVLPYGSYMWTGNEISMLTEHGFKVRSLSNPQVGDVLWHEGHTEIYLGNGMQGGARHGDYAGGTHGRKGDQDGTEVTKSKYVASNWTKLLRYEGTVKCEGIPAPIAAAQVALHIIDHNAHGYSQPNRAGDGTIEEITISWDEGKLPDLIPASFSIKVTEATNARAKPMISADITGTHPAGKVIKLDGIMFHDGRIWGHYFYKGKAGKHRYVSLGNQNSWIVVT